MTPDTTFSIVTAPRQNSKKWRKGVVSWAELCTWLEHPADHKACGNYVLGTLNGNERTRTTIATRSAITLDSDTARPDLPENVGLLLPGASLVHTTFQSAPDAPRYRIVVPVDRELLPDEYHAAASALMELLGSDQFDRGSVEPWRYMFKPSAEHREWYQYWVFEGPALNADKLLENFDPDLSSLALPSPHRNKRDPFELGGTVGAFNRAYEDFQTLIETYELPYEVAASSEGRWQLTGTASVAGMGVVAPGLVYSHHITDPAYGQACSAFDLVRLHRYADLDDPADKTPVNRRPSHAAMLDLAAQDDRVVLETVSSDFDTEADPGSWKLGLKRNSRTLAVRDTVGNWDLLVEHEPVFQHLTFNEFSLAVEVTEDLPWRTMAHAGPLFSETDRSELAFALEREHQLPVTMDKLNRRVNATAARTRVNPVRDYLDALEWDGVPRVEECLPGVRATRYSRMVARKCLVAAVARIYEPGVKWDHAMVFYGKQGLGKTEWIEWMALGKYTATLGRIGDKDTLIVMQRNWILVSDEGYSLRKADADVQKEFLTRRHDVFRMPYDREAGSHPRHSVIWGTTNDEVFLRRQEGNRRFLIVRCEHKVDLAAVTPGYVAQVWAEAVALYRQGDQLWLTDEEDQLAEVERENFTEEDALAGLIGAYLDLPVPEEWPTMSPDARTAWRQSFTDGLVSADVGKIQMVCTTQVASEGLGRRASDAKRTDLLEITAALKRVPGWRQLTGRQQVPWYGMQQVFVREGDFTADLDEVL